MQIRNINNSDFKPSYEMKLYIENIIANFNLNILRNVKKVVYISGPATGIDNYIEKFDEVYSFLSESKEFDKCCIINPMSILDEYEDSTYIDKIFLTLKIMDITDILILDDRSEKWKESKGVLIELVKAYEKGITILSFSKLLKYREDPKADKELYNYLMGGVNNE